MVVVVVVERERSGVVVVVVEVGEKKGERENEGGRVFEGGPPGFRSESVWVWPLDRVGRVFSVMRTEM